MHSCWRGIQSSLDDRVVRMQPREPWRGRGDVAVLSSNRVELDSLWLGRGRLDPVVSREARAQLTAAAQRPPKSVVRVRWSGVRCPGATTKGHGGAV